MAVMDKVPESGRGDDATHAKLVKDLSETPSDELWSLIRRQPSKFWWKLATMLLALIAFASTVGERFGDLHAKYEGNRENVSLQRQVAVLQAELAGANKSIEDLKDDQRRYLLQNKDAQMEILRLHGEITDRDRQLVKARGCEAIRAESEAIFARARDMQRIKHTKRVRPTDDELEEEANLLAGRLELIKGQLDNCAK